MSVLVGASYVIRGMDGKRLKSDVTRDISYGLARDDGMDRLMESV